MPTIGFNVETVQYKNLRFQVWDLGGQTSIRPYWRCYYQNTNAVIYVVDSADPERMGISKQELMAMLEEEELKDAALMVFANKQDLPVSVRAQPSRRGGSLSLVAGPWGAGEPDGRARHHHGRAASYDLERACQSAEIRWEWVGSQRGEQ